MGKINLFFCTFMVPNMHACYGNVQTVKLGILFLNLDKKHRLVVKSLDCYRYKSTKIDAIDLTDIYRFSAGFSEFDRILGCGRACHLGCGRFIARSTLCANSSRA